MNDMAERAVAHQFIRNQLDAMKEIRSSWNVYKSFALGGNIWGKLGCGSTYASTAIAWYQTVHKPGSREWRPSVIWAKLVEAAREPVNGN